MKLLRATLPVLLAAALAAGCSTSRWYGYAFTPAPNEARVVDERVPDSQARALVTLAGIRRPHDGEPALVEVRMRLSNVGGTPMKLGREGLELVTAGLEALRPALPSLGEGIDLAPGETIVHTFLFPLPEGRSPHDLNFDGAAFCWSLDFGQGPIATSISFQRVADGGTCRHGGWGYGWGYGYPHPYYGAYYWW